MVELTGPGATTVTILPADRPDAPLSIAPGANGSTVIRSTALDFITWGTTRRGWRNYCVVTGDESAATPFLDRLNII